ncbi:C-X-C motif chemokine 11 [Varanus komodoensis]|uniref:C-X-C motif chemokine 11 n=1 Tax=Varanus komodoensis TaxID=61221 RepID=UPI001CF7882B|nr:C-X-C motif chemokine 11 [Varanus komodoensis]
MIKKSILAILIFLLCTALIQGMPTSGRGRCLCHGRSVTLVRMSNVAKVEFHPPSSSCDQEELIVYFKRNGKRRCLDVNMDQGRRIREEIMRKRK